MTEFALRKKTLVVVLAGGRATRLGGADKPLLRLDGKTILGRIVAAMQPQCETLIINANDDATRFAEYDAPVVADTLPGHAGPLAGILAALEWTASHRPQIEWIASVPGDTPFLPSDLVERLHRARVEDSASVACATSGGRIHPTIGLWPVSLAASLRHALDVEKVRAVRAWISRHRVAYAEWPVEPFDPFFNINTPEDLAGAEAMMETVYDISSARHD
ncbi:molybdenum cofactor guanylyltransferase MobA [Microvirga sp. 2MCAF38]|uniref:molybdenum cofactor guanylyltransferase MobA n=1 Tax=Microvirga sp. 2MCAF38 TaxID=3232989 RepID=UPI003F944838